MISIITKLWRRLALVIACASVAACENVVPMADEALALSDLDSLRVAGYEVSPQSVKEHFAKLAARNLSGTDTDVFLRKYYCGSEPRTAWITPMGITADADTLLSLLSDVASHGVTAKLFPTSQIASDLEAFRSLDFKNADINELVARLEFNLSKAYLLYTAGLRFGFASPYRSINTLDKSADEVKRILGASNFGLELEYPDSMFFAGALERVRSREGFREFVDSCMPQSTFYAELQQKYANHTASDTTARAKYAANMERQRWHIKDAPENHQKYVLVNIPSYELWGVCPDSILNMKIVCGATKTPSPILNSRIKRIDLNPQWYVPMSIIRKGLAHAGPGYFARNNMYFVTSGGQVKKYATPAERMSGKVAIVQRGGSSNSLGRIIFRFDNRFSVYLHHTNAPWAFQAGKRAISHGCIRLQRPLDLARFVLSDSNQDKYDKIEYSFQCDLSSKDSTMFIKKVDLEPQIPVYLLYNTLFRAPGSNVVSEYADVYGLDRKLYYKLMRIVDPIDSARNANKEKSRQSGSTASSERKKPSADSNRVSSPSSEHPSNNATVKREDDNKPTV